MIRLLSAFGYVTLIVAIGRAGEPVLRNVNVRGLQVGGTTTIVCDGDELAGARLLLPFSAKAELKKGSTDKQASFDVTLGTDIAPGYYHLRVVTDQGVSAPTIIGVDRLPQRALASTPFDLPVALHGAIAGSAAAEARFAGKAGQKLQVEVEAQRLGSKLRPVIHVHSPRHLQVAWAWPSPALSGDVRLETTLPEDGAYTVTLHDTEYAAAAPSFYRLKLGQWSHIDHVFPPVIGQGRAQAVELVGAGHTYRADAPAAATARALPLAWPGDGLWSGPRPFVNVSTHPELIEQLATAKPQDLPAGPLGVSGRLDTPFEEHRYRLPVTPGSKVRLEAFAERIGSPLDAALVVRNEAGADLARAEDSPGTLDPVLEYAVPANVNTVIVAVVDAEGRGGPRGIYRLVVDPQSAGPADFRLVATDPALSLPVGGRGVVPVLVERRGYKGSVEVAAAGLPGGLRLSNSTIPPEADGTLITVERSDGAADAAITSWQGRAADGAVRPVSIKGHALERLQPWLAEEIAVAPTSAKAADFQVDWRGLADNTGLVPSKKVALPVKVTRADANTVVKLTLLTSQRATLVNNQPDPNQTLRLEKAIELAAKGKNEEDLSVIVPPLLAGPIYDLTVQAELLTPDKKTVKAVAYAPVRRMNVNLPIVVKLDGPALIEATLDAKKETTLKIAGQIERREGVTGDVTITLTGLPAGARVDTPTIKGDAKTFGLNIVLPATLPAAEIRAIKVTAAIAPDPKQPNIRVKSRAVDLTLIIKKAT
jgi:hypothetical protein